jgi:hypothetical protein
MTVHATITGAVSGTNACLFLYGGNDQAGQTHRKVMVDEPIEFEFDTYAYSHQTKLLFTFASLNSPGIRCRARSTTTS